MHKTSKKYLSSESFRMGHSLVMGNRPIEAEAKNKIDLKNHLEQTAKFEIETLGLFDSTSPNFVGYYPDVTQEDLNPKDDEFIYPVFRALSNVIVRPNAPIDFGASLALKQSLSMLVGQTVFPNHEMVTGDELGVILKAEWVEAKEVKLTDGSPFTIPAGINVTLKLDGKSNPKVARAIMMDPPAIHSVSVTVEFEWEQSHQNLERDDFMNRLGTYDEVGSLIKRNVTGIKRYHEISLVPHGADPFAQKVGADGNIVNPDFANATYSFSESTNEQEATRVLSSNTSRTELSFKGVDSFSLQATIPKQLNNQNKQNLKENTMYQELRTLLGSAAEGLSDNEVLAKVKESFVASSNNVTLLATANESLTAANESLTAVKAELKVANGYKDVAEAATKSLRDEAIRLCNLVNGGSADAGLLAILGEANYETAVSFHAQYKKMADEKFGEGSVQNQDGDTASNSDEGSNSEGDAPKEALSIAEAAEKLQATKVDTSSIHGKASK